MPATAIATIEPSTVLQGSEPTGLSSDIHSQSGQATMPAQLPRCQRNAVLSQLVGHRDFDSAVEDDVVQSLSSWLSLDLPFTLAAKGFKIRVRQVDARRSNALLEAGDLRGPGNGERDRAALEHSGQRDLARNGTVLLGLPFEEAEGRQINLFYGPVTEALNFETKSSPDGVKEI